MPSPAVVDGTISHDAVLVWLAKQSRDFVSAVQTQTAPPPSVSDSVAVDELVQVRIGSTLSVFDGVTETEVVAVLMGLPVSVQDVAGSSEVVLVSLNVLTVVVNDVAVASELAIASFNLEVFVIESDAVAEAVSFELGLVIFDVTVPIDVVVVQVPLMVRVVDGADPPAEVVAGEFNAVLCTAIDTVVVTEIAALHQTVIIQVFDAEVIDERRFAAMQKVKKIRVRPQGG